MNFGLGYRYSRQDGRASISVSGIQIVGCGSRFGHVTSQPNHVRAASVLMPRLPVSKSVDPSHRWNLEKIGRKCMYIMYVHSKRELHLNRIYSLQCHFEFSSLYLDSVLNNLCLALAAWIWHTDILPQFHAPVQYLSPLLLDFRTFVFPLLIYLFKELQQMVSRQ
jgi:hypothetical protein